jgi:hypothetical protein
LLELFSPPLSITHEYPIVEEAYSFQTSSIYGDPAHLNSNLYNVRGAQDDVSWGVVISMKIHEGWMLGIKIVGEL